MGPPSPYGPNEPIQGASLDLPPPLRLPRRISRRLAGPEAASPDPPPPRHIQIRWRTHIEGGTPKEDPTSMPRCRCGRHVLEEKAWLRRSHARGKARRHRREEREGRRRPVVGVRGRGVGAQVREEGRWRSENPKSPYIYGSLVMGFLGCFGPLHFRRRAL